MRAHGFLTFSDVYVGPTEAVLKAPASSFFRGGPLWPDFEKQVLARQCREREVKVMDDKPTFEPTGRLVYEEGLWCGPIVHHYGHMIADFGMRLALSAHLHPSLPLVFSTALYGPKEELREPPPYFWAMVDSLKINRKRIHLVARPTLFRKLHVYPQAERIRGPVPDEQYLELLDRINLIPRTMKEKPIKHLYVSRSKYLLGGLAGEAYLSQVLAATGVQVIQPETLPLKTQLDLYASSQNIIFSEGSAVHSLQLMGRLASNVAVLVRRPKSRLAQNSLLPRVRSLEYLEASRGLIYGLRPSGHANESKGITVLDGLAIVEQLSRLKIDLKKHWNSGEFQKQCEKDIRAWSAQRLSNSKAHAGEKAAIQDSLAKLSLDIAIDW